MDKNLSKLWEIVKNREAWWATVPQRVGHDLATEQQQLLPYLILCPGVFPGFINNLY